MTAAMESNNSTKPIIVCVDDEERVLKSLKRSLIRESHALHFFTDGASALDFIEAEKGGVDLIISDMRMPRMDGAAVLEQASKKWPNVGRILLTGYADMNSTMSAINQGKVFAYLQKPWDDNALAQTVHQAWSLKTISDERSRLTQLAHSQNQKLKELNGALDDKVKRRTAILQAAVTKLESANLTLSNQHMSHIKMMMSLMEQRSFDGREHSKEVVNHAMTLAEALKLDDQTQEDIYNAATIHDIGLIGLPDQLLESSYNRLQSADRKKYQEHSEIGQQLLIEIPQLNNVGRLIRHHHEHFDGSGYPDGLSGDEIPIGSQIIAISSDLHDLRYGHLKGRKFSDVESQEFLLAHMGHFYSQKLVELSIDILAEKEVEELDNTLINESDDMDVRNGILTSDLVTRDGVLLLAKGTRMNKKLLQKIKSSKRKL